MNKKSYCFFSAQYLPHVGGVENYTYHLAKELVNKGHSVTIVASNVEGAAEFEIQEGITVYRMPCFNLINGRFPIPRFNQSFRKIYKIILEKSFDMIIVNTRFYVHSLLGLLVAKKKRCRVIFIEHGTGHLKLHNAVLDFLENIVEHTITIPEKILCKEFYGVSEACVEWLKHFHIKGQGVFYNAIDINEINQQIKKPIYSFREKYSIPEDSEIVVFVGRLLKEKGIITLIKAFDEINHSETKRYLLIAGDGDEFETVQKLKSKYIIPVGRISSNEVIALLRESQIFCLPSDSEGMPTSVLEAAACRNYIVTTKQGGAKELVLDESYGIIMDNNDEKTVKYALQHAFADPRSREEGIEKTYQRLVTYFTWDKIAEKIVRL